MKYSLLAKRYSKALAQNIKPEEYGKALDDISLIREVLRNTEEILATVNSFLLNQEKRVSLAVSVIKDANLFRVWKNLFSILIQKHKFTLLPVILKELESIILSRQNKIKVKLMLASRQPENTIKQIRERIEKVLEKQVLLDINFDPNIIGGFMVYTDSMTIDASIRNNLIKFTESINS